MAKKANEIVALQIRIREGLRQKIERAAKANEQSMNAEIVGMLEGAFDEQSRALDFRTAVAAITGGGENAQLLSMIASALQLVTAYGSKDPAHVDNMEIFHHAVTAIVAAHAGKPYPRMKYEEMKGWTTYARQGFGIADMVLVRNDLPSVIEWPPVEPGGLASLEKNYKPATVGGDFRPLSELGKLPDK